MKKLTWTIVGSATVFYLALAAVVTKAVGWW